MAQPITVHLNPTGPIVRTGGDASFEPCGDDGCCTAAFVLLYQGVKCQDHLEQLEGEEAECDEET